MTIAFPTIPLGLLNKSTTWRQLGLETKDLRRLLILECEINLRLLDHLALEPDTKNKSNEIVFFKAAGRLRASAIELVLGLDDKAAKTFKDLGSIPLPIKDDDTQIDQDSKRLSVARKLELVYIAVTTAKELASIVTDVGSDSSNLKGLKPMHMKTRLRNLQRVYRDIVNAIRR